MVITEVSNIVKELLDEQNKSIFELAKYLNMKPVDLKNKLKPSFDKLNINNFTVNQLEKIGDFFDCELHIDYVNRESGKRYHSTTINEVRAELMKDFEDWMSDIF